MLNILCHLSISGKGVGASSGENVLGKARREQICTAGFGCAAAASGTTLITIDGGPLTIWSPVSISVSSWSRCSVQHPMVFDLVV